MESAQGMNLDVNFSFLNEDRTGLTSPTCRRKTAKRSPNQTSFCNDFRKETKIASGTRLVSTTLQPLPIGVRDAWSSLWSIFYRNIMPIGCAMDVLGVKMLLLTVLSCLILSSDALDVGKSNLSCLFSLQWGCIFANIVFIKIFHLGKFQCEFSLAKVIRSSFHHSIMQCLLRLLSVGVGDLCWTWHALSNRSMFKL